MCESTQGSLCQSSMKIHYWPFLKNFRQKVNKPKWPLDNLKPHICWCLMCDSTQRSWCPTPMVIDQSMWIQWLFFKSLTKRSMTPRWPLNPLLLRSHVWLYPRIIVSKSHENISKCVDTMIIFQTLWPKDQWPKWPPDDLQPHFCYGHMCDSTQELLCPTPINIYQSMWIQWSSFQKLKPKIWPRWPLTPLLLRSHICLYPRIIVSMSHGNTSMQVDTVINFAKL